jgi:hypothetical protein
MKRAVAAKSCGSTVSAKSNSADHEFVCGVRQYRLTREDDELPQYRTHSAEILVKYF